MPPQPTVCTLPHWIWQGLLGGAFHRRLTEQLETCPLVSEVSDIGGNVEGRRKTLMLTSKCVQGRGYCLRQFCLSSLRLAFPFTLAATAPF